MAANKHPESVPAGSARKHWYDEVKWRSLYSQCYQTGVPPAELFEAILKIACVVTRRFGALYGLDPEFRVIHEKDEVPRHPARQWDDFAQDVMVKTMDGILTEPALRKYYEAGKSDVELGKYFWKMAKHAWFHCLRTRSNTSRSLVRRLKDLLKAGELIMWDDRSTLCTPRGWGCPKTPALGDDEFVSRLRRVPIQMRMKSIKQDRLEAAVRQIFDEVNSGLTIRQLARGLAVVFQRSITEVPLQEEENVSVDEYNRQLSAKESISAELHNTEGSIGEQLISKALGNGCGPAAKYEVQELLAIRLHGLNKLTDDETAESITQLTGTRISGSTAKNRYNSGIRRIKKTVPFLNYEYSVVFRRLLDERLRESRYDVGRIDAVVPPDKRID